MKHFFGDREDSVGLLARKHHGLARRAQNHVTGQAVSLYRRIFSRTPASETDSSARKRSDQRREDATNFHGSVSRRRRAGSGHARAVQVLEAVHFPLHLLERVDPAHRSFCGGERRDARNVVANGGAANGFFVVERFAAQRRVDDQWTLPVLMRSTMFGRPSFTLKHFLARNAGGAHRRAGAARGNDFESQRARVPCPAGRYAVCRDHSRS